MAVTSATPGIYIEEIPLQRWRISAVETAVPAFAGFTEKKAAPAAATPVLVHSLSAFEALFGKGYVIPPGDLHVRRNAGNQEPISEVSTNGKVFYLHASIRLYFQNGGGSCFVRSAGTFVEAHFENGTLQNTDALLEALEDLGNREEPTLLLVPDAVSLSGEGYAAVQRAMLSQCGARKDRFAILDLQEQYGWKEAGGHFREGIGTAHLEYGAAYTPWLLAETPSAPFHLFGRNGAAPHIYGADGTPLDLLSLTEQPDLQEKIKAARISAGDLFRMEGDVNGLTRSSGLSLREQFDSLRTSFLSAPSRSAPSRFKAMLVYLRKLAHLFPRWRNERSPFRLENGLLVQELDTAAPDGQTGLRKFIKDLVALERNETITALVTGGPATYKAYRNTPRAGVDSWLGIRDILSWEEGTGIPPSPAVYGSWHTTAEKRAALLHALSDLESIFSGLNDFLEGLRTSATRFRDEAEDVLYRDHPMVKAIIQKVNRLSALCPPSGAVAGVYARTDRDRGVWKAPANAALTGIGGTAYAIRDEEQEDLNIDPVGGKSINAIRTFTGSQTLVWGARTIAGNSNEWRYVSVRRFCTMVIQAVRKGIQPCLFQPNDATTWTGVRESIGLFLHELFRSGSLQGLKPEDAYFIRTGLGSTMTPADILEGRLIVEIGLAVVRPAEFVILRIEQIMNPC